MEVSGLVSVVIPTYKRDISVLDRAVKSVLMQSFDKIEIIVVDDNDPNSCYRKKNISYFGNYRENKNVVYITNEKNMGVSYSRNCGIKYCHGEYVTFLDDDDEYDVDKVYNQVTFMKKHNLDMSFTELKIYNADGKVIDYREYHDISSFEKNNLLRYHLTRQITGTPTFMLRTSAIKKIGGFDNYSMGEEFHLMLKAIENELKIGYCPTCDIIVHHHTENGLSTGGNKIKGENRLYKFKKQYFNELGYHDRAFIRFRHYAVLVIAHMKNRNYCFAIFSGIVAFFSSPIIFLKEVSSFLSKIKKQNINLGEK